MTATIVVDITYAGFASVMNHLIIKDGLKVKASVSLAAIPRADDTILATLFSRNNPFFNTELVVVNVYWVPSFAKKNVLEPIIRIKPIDFSEGKTETNCHTTLEEERTRLIEGLTKQVKNGEIQFVIG